LIRSRHLSSSVAALFILQSSNIYASPRFAENEHITPLIQKFGSRPAARKTVEQTSGAPAGDYETEL
jgi:hypothetical protein